MKLLLDENLSRRLVPLLQELFPGSSHVVLVGQERVADQAIWAYAKAHDFVIVTRDADFQELSLLSSAPPHVVRLRGENLSKADALSMLTAHEKYIKSKIDEGISYIEIIGPRSQRL